MGVFTRSNNLRLDSRTDTTISYSVPPKTSDFTSVASTAHTLPYEQILEDLGVNEKDGLTKNEAQRRLQSCGENLLEGKGGVTAWRVLVSQLGMSTFQIFSYSTLFRGSVAIALTLVLLAALALSFGVQDFIEGAVIAAVIVLNTTYVYRPRALGEHPPPD